MDVGIAAIGLLGTVMTGVIAFIGAVLKGQQEKITALEARLDQQQQKNEQLIRENADLNGRVRQLESQSNHTTTALIAMTQDRDYWRGEARFEHDRAEAYEATLLRNQVDVPTVERRAEKAER